jgi:LCP family protein required for cell wall assembly
MIGLVLGWSLGGLAILVAGFAGGVYLFLHREVSNFQAHSLPVRVAARRLNVAVPHRPTIALVIGSDHRASDPAGSSSRSDTLILIRSDPQANALSFLSLPRDLVVNRICPGRPTVVDRINSAFAICGPVGTLATVKALTGLKINYLITVNFHGFKQIVDRLGGIWLDVDRRYYNQNVGTADTNYTNIDLHPGYQKLSGEQALAFVRYRHTDSDIYRTARQQLFLTALKQQVRRTWSPFGLPGLIDTISHSIEIAAGGGAPIPASTVLAYLLFAYRLPPGHIVHDQIGGLQPYGYANAELTASPTSIANAVAALDHPDLGPRLPPARAAAPDPPAAPAPSRTVVLVLNGNGRPGTAATLGGLLRLRGYRIAQPPGGGPANAPSFNYTTSRVYFDPRRPAAHAAAVKLSTLLGNAVATSQPPPISDPGALVTVIAGSAFQGALGSAPASPPPAPSTATPQAAAVAVEPQVTEQTARDAQRRLPFRVELPTVLERNSVPDAFEPAHIYRISGSHSALRLVFRTGLDYWGIEETDWTGTPALAGGTARTIGGRTFELYYTGARLHVVALREHGASYWVTNSLLDKLSNQTMLAIARGLRPL